MSQHDIHSLWSHATEGKKLHSANHTNRVLNSDSDIVNSEYYYFF